MTAFTTTWPLPTARSVEANVGKAVDPEGRDPEGGRFSDVFRDLGRSPASDGAPAGRADGAAAAGEAATDTAEAAPARVMTLAEALASASSSRASRSTDGTATAAEGAATAATPPSAETDAAAAPAKATPNTSKASAGIRSGTAQSRDLHVNALRLAAADAKAAAARAQAAPAQTSTATDATAAQDAAAGRADAGPLDPGALAQAGHLATAADPSFSPRTPAPTTISVDPADAEAPSADTAATAKDRPAEATPRRLQGHLGLTALLFGRSAADFTAAMADHTGRPDTTGDLPSATDDSVAVHREAEPEVDPDLAAADAALLARGPDAQPLPAFLAPHPLTAAAPAGAEAGGDPAHAGATGGTAALDADGPTTAQPMRITILSRETHFAPIRTLTLNGASAPARADASDAPAAKAVKPAAVSAAPSNALPGNPATSPLAGATARPVSEAATVARTLTAATGARNALAATPVAPARSDAEPTAVSAPVAEAEVEPATNASVRTPLRGAARDGAARTTRDAAETGTSRTLDARTIPSATEARTDAAASPPEQEPAPVAGVAAIGGAILPAAPAPALATLRQIGAAIAAEAGGMGASSGAEAPSTTLAGPVRLLDIQLSPDDLGTVNVRMRLSGNGLEIRLRASNAETARVLERDQSALIDLLAASGITADSITIIGGDGAGFTQLTGQDAGRPLLNPQPSAGEPDAPANRDNGEPQGRASDDDRPKGQARDDQARSPGRAPDAGSTFRV